MTDLTFPAVSIREKEIRAVVEVEDGQLQFKLEVGGRLIMLNIESLLKAIDVTHHDELVQAIKDAIPGMTEYEY